MCPSDPQVDGGADAAAPAVSERLLRAVRRSVSLEDVISANGSARSGTQLGNAFDLALPEDSARLKTRLRRGPSTSASRARAGQVLA